MKPQLAKDADLLTLPYPDVVSLPKIDGVRGMNLEGTFTGRSLDPFEGFGVTEYFSQRDFIGFDGEITLGDKPFGVERLCHLTTGALGRIYEEQGKKRLLTAMADFHWWIFDYVTPETIRWPYVDRHYRAAKQVEALQHPRIRIVPYVPVADHPRALQLIGAHLDLGYEGTIWRNRKAAGKEGRSGKKLQEFVRSKPWIDSEMLVTGVTEGMRNTNEAKTNSLGQMERSLSKAGMVPNEQIGSLQGTLLADIFSPFSGKLLFSKGHPVTIAPGEMTIAEATAWFKDQAQIVGHIVKFKHLAYGVKDQPRMGTFMSKRLPQDMS